MNHKAKRARGPGNDMPCISYLTQAEQQAQRAGRQPRLRRQQAAPVLQQRPQAVQRRPGRLAGDLLGTALQDGGKCGGKRGQAGNTDCVLRWDQYLDGTAAFVERLCLE